MNRFLCGSVLLVVLSSGISSCSLQRLIVGKKNAVTTTVADTNKVVTVVPVQNRIVLPEQDTFSNAPDTAGLMKQLVDMISPVYDSRLQYSSFSAKAKVHFESPEDKQDFTANIRLKKDTAIWVDITALGGMFHAARVYITPDSLFMINYQQKSGTRISLADVAKILPTKVDFMSLQNLIIGAPLRNGVIKDVAVLGATWLLHVADSSYAQTINYRKQDSVMVSDQVNTIAPNGPQATLRYDNFELFSGRKVSTSRAVDILNGADKFLLEMELQGVEFDKQLEMPFSIPKNYSNK